MAVTTTVRPGPRSTDRDGLDEAIASHPIWTELRGPVSGYTPLYSPTSSTLTIPTGTLTGSLAGSYTTQYTYWANGAARVTDDPAEGGLPSEPVNDAYDNYGLLLTVGGSQLYLGGIEWTGIGQTAASSAETGSVVAQDRDYYQDGSGRLTQAQTNLTIGSNSPIITASDVYGYDNAGDVTSDTDTTAASTDAQCFGYDYDQRLTAAWTPTSGNCATAPSSSKLGGPAPYWTSYSYDGDSDRLSSTEHATTGSGNNTVDTYPYPSGKSVVQPHAVLSVKHKTGSNTSTDRYAYNAAGQTTTVPGHTLGYDAEGRLSTDTTGAGTETRVYTPDGTLLLQSGPGGGELWNGDTEVFTDSAGNLSALRTYRGLGRAVAERTTTTGGGSTVYLIESDPHGSYTQTVDATGTVTNRYEDPFGNVRGAAPTVPDDKSFLGDPTDATNGLVTVGQRAYQPTLGRFLTIDPPLEIGSPQQLNGYGYAGSNPVTNSDPTGLEISGEGGGGEGGEGDQPDPPLSGNGTGDRAGEGPNSSAIGGGSPADRAYDAHLEQVDEQRTLEVKYLEDDTYAADTRENLLDDPSLNHDGPKTTEQEREHAAEEVGGLAPTLDKAFQFGGAGRSGAGVKNFVGPESSVVRGASPGRIFVTDDQGRVIFDITRDRVKPVVPGQGFISGDGRKPDAYGRAAQLDQRVVGWMTMETDPMDTYQASLNELFQNFRDALLALLPIAKRAEICFQDNETHRDWERLAKACFDAFVRSPIDADQAHTPGELPLARYDIDLDGFLGVSWLTVDELAPHRGAVVRLLSRSSPLDTVQVVDVDPDTLRAGRRSELPISGIKFAYYRRNEDGGAHVVSRVEAVE